jgi:hypothetical protein
MENNNMENNNMENNNMENNNIQNNINKKDLLFCKKCNFQTVNSYEFIKLVNTKKHDRNGLKIKEIIFKCEKCEKILANHFSYKIHLIQKHATIEEKKNQKYYCEICDTIFISKLYMDKHNIGKKHHNMLKLIEIHNNMNNNLIV